MTDRLEGMREDAHVVPRCVTPRTPRRWRDDKRAKGFSRGGPRKGVAYQMERVKVITPQCEEARQAYTLDSVALRLGHRRESLRSTLFRSGLPYLVVRGGKGMTGRGRIYIPRRTLDALVARLIQVRRGH